MGNITTKSVGDIQANVGTVSSDISLMVTYIFAGILILLAIGLAIASFVPMKPWDCEDLDDLRTQATIACNYPQVPQPFLCKEAQDAYNKEQERCNTPVKQTWLLWFLFLIPLAVIIIFVSRWWNHLVHTNKTAAIIQGTGFELQTARNIFSGR